MKGLRLNLTQWKEDIFFYMWQLKIKTLGELFQFATEQRCENGQDLINALCKAYNSEDYLNIK